MLIQWKLNIPQQCVSTVQFFSENQAGRLSVISRLVRWPVCWLPGSLVCHAFQFAQNPLVGGSAPQAGQLPGYLPSFKNFCSMEIFKLFRLGLNFFRNVNFLWNGHSSSCTALEPGSCYAPCFCHWSAYRGKGGLSRLPLESWCHFFPFFLPPSCVTITITAHYACYNFPILIGKLISIT